ncbi:hypothetical protein PR048_032310 [Dryococelus australis]|uniref:Reverse transcriptase n=1 Tax=Dryococelus australis TaxID=614101 RepID=A0ABQ9G1V5_9NEOP|nr:hypothetical protein PR048_032310 [Dryococelus australis]
MRVFEVNMEQRRNEGAVETGDPREDPPTNGIIRHDSHLKKSGERVNRSATVALTTDGISHHDTTAYFTILPLRWSLLPLLVFYRSELNHSFIDPLQLNSNPDPEACRNIYSADPTIWNVQCTPSLAEITRNICGENSNRDVLGLSLAATVATERNGPGRGKAVPCNKGAQNHILQELQDIRARMKIKWINVNHYSVQLFTGHGKFKAKLHSFRLVQSPLCDVCGVDDAVQHVIMECLKTKDMAYQREREFISDYKMPRSIKLSVRSGKSLPLQLVEDSRGLRQGRGEKVLSTVLLISVQSKCGSIERMPAFGPCNLLQTHNPSPCRSSVMDGCCLCPSNSRQPFARYAGNTARLARRSDGALGVRVSVAHVIYGSRQNGEESLCSFPARERERDKGRVRAAADLQRVPGQGGRWLPGIKQQIAVPDKTLWKQPSAKGKSPARGAESDVIRQCDTKTQFANRSLMPYSPECNTADKETFAVRSDQSDMRTCRKSSPKRMIGVNMRRRRNEGGRGKWETPEKTRRPTASSSTIPTCENPWSDHSPHAHANRVRFPARSSEGFYHVVISCRTMPLVGGGFSRGSPVFLLPFHSDAAPRSPGSTLIGCPPHSLPTDLIALFL